MQPSADMSPGRRRGCDRRRAQTGMGEWPPLVLGRCRGRVMGAERRLLSRLKRRQNRCQRADAMRTRCPSASAAARQSISGSAAPCTTHHHAPRTTYHVPYQTDPFTLAQGRPARPSTALPSRERLRNPTCRRCHSCIWCHSSPSLCDPVPK